MSKLFKSILLLAMLPLLFLGCNSVEETQESKIGMILVGPKNDKGWSQAHYEGGEYAASKLGGEMITVDMVNPADSPDLTIPSVVEDMISQGATIIFATSDDMKDGILEAAEKYPDTDFVWSTGDSALVVGRDYRSELKNVSNVMGKMEYGQMIAGCAAAIKSKTGKIGFLGPLVNDETRRLANATYLGAKHCADGDIEFDITWIGFWFHIPGMTLDPTQVVNDFYDSGKDVVISHIDTTEAVVVTGQRAEKGEDIWVKLHASVQRHVWCGRGLERQKSTVESADRVRWHVEGVEREASSFKSERTCN